MSTSPPSGPRRRGLGRGLDALLSSGTGTDTHHGGLAGNSAGDETGRLIEIDPHRVDPNPEQPRTVFHGGELDALVDSVRTHGVLQPIVVEPTAGGGHQLIAGERRLRAARAAGLSSVPAIVRPAVESARQALELALTENLVRSDLSPLEEAVAYSRLADTFGLSHEAIAIRVGRSRASISNTVRLLSLAPPVLAALAEGRLSAGHARALLALPAPDEQERLAQRIEAEQLSVREVEHAVQQSLDGTPIGRAPKLAGRGGPETPASGPHSPDEAALLRGFEAAVGAPVRIERRRRGGRLIMEFHSDDELDGLYQRLGGPPL